MEVLSPAPLVGRHRLSKPVAAPAAHLPFVSARRAADSNRDAYTPVRFGAAPASLAGSLSVGERLPAGVNGREMAEDGELESHGDEPPPGFRPGPAAWLVHPPRRAGDSNTTALAAQSLAVTPDP
jgi:hypothetical protein